MPAHKLVPDCNTLRRWRDAGYTQEQMVDLTEEMLNVRVTRSAIAQAMVRCGLSTDKARYSDELPWRVRPEHAKEYPARMLRLLGRRRNGGEMSERDSQRLDSWLAKLKAERAVVAYDPEHPDGFAYVPRQPGDGVAVPIRKGIVRLPR